MDNYNAQTDNYVGGLSAKLRAVDYVFRLDMGTGVFCQICSSMSLLFCPDDGIVLSTEP